MCLAHHAERKLHVLSEQPVDALVDVLVLERQQEAQGTFGNKAHPDETSGVSIGCSLLRSGPSSSCQRGRCWLCYGSDMRSPGDASQLGRGYVCIWLT
jgi:hypothetical protein